MVVVAGPNGAGKSTLTKHLIDAIPVIDPDRIDAADALEAGKRVFGLVDGYISARVSFALETTLSGVWVLQRLRLARNAGFRVELHFVGLDQVETAILRVRERVATGGHDVPLRVQRRRFPRCFENLWRCALLANRTVIYDNAIRQGFRELGAFSSGRKTALRRDWPEWAKSFARRSVVGIRPEIPADIPAIFALTEEAFATLEISDHTEQFIIDRLRAAGALTLSLVAERAGRVVGHIAFSPVTISDGTTGWFGLGPVSVTPELQRRGIGAALIRDGLERLKAMGAKGCYLVGHPGYYGRFGFVNEPGLVFPHAPAEACFALAFDGRYPRGEVAFHPAFFPGAG